MKKKCNKLPDYLPFSSDHFNKRLCPKTHRKFKIVDKMNAYCVTPDGVCSECGRIYWQGVYKYTEARRKY